MTKDMFTSPSCEICYKKLSDIAINLEINNYPYEITICKECFNKMKSLVNEHESKEKSQ